MKYPDDFVGNIIHGDCLKVMRNIPDNVIDTLITDPPAGISFMGKEWDGDKGGRDEWIKWLTSVLKECYRVMKPGAIGLAWALPRTSHWTALAIEDAEFELRDCIYHLFGQGMPKGMDISKSIDREAGKEREIVGEKRLGDGSKARKTQKLGGNATFSDPVSRESNLYVTAPATEEAIKWNGWHTCLKPAVECWWVFMKPLDGSYAENAIKHGVTGFNIDGSRIGTKELEYRTTSYREAKSGEFSSQNETNYTTGSKKVIGRFPNNAILDEESAQQLDEQTGILTSGKPVGKRAGTSGESGIYQSDKNREGSELTGYGDSGGASRFFYCAKAAKEEKGEGNKHPTVKPLKLMQYLCRLTKTPSGGIVLDPFAGSGSTLVAAKLEGRQFIGIEFEKEYCKIAERRLNELL
jgi:site-specific DNA-methyltransferase (adenine-specific)